MMKSLNSLNQEADTSLITLNDAKKQGEKRFFTGIPCKHGHRSERYVSSRDCIECQKICKGKARAGKRKYSRGEWLRELLTAHTPVQSEPLVSTIAEEFGAEPFTVADLAARGVKTTKRWLNANIGVPSGGYCLVAVAKQYGTPAWRLSTDCARACLRTYPHHPDSPPCGTAAHFVAIREARQAILRLCGALSRVGIVIGQLRASYGDIGGQAAFRARFG